MITAIIVDDEIAALEYLQLIITTYIPEITQLYTTTCPQNAISLCELHRPNLLFLDIQMPVINGIELMQQLHNFKGSVIFTTAYNQYAIQAIKLSALDYLLKPIAEQELKEAVQRYIKNQVPINQNINNNFFHNIQVKNAADYKITLPTFEGTFFYHISQIVYIEGDNNYSRFYISNAKPVLVSKTLKEYDEILVNLGFIRIHKSYLINKTHVTQFTQDGFISLSNNARLEISRRKKAETMEQLKMK
jgi:two-component system, LytTR family, response regulator